MSLIYLPSPVVEKIASFLTPQDAFSYLSVVAPHNLASFPPSCLRLTRPFHGDDSAATALLRWARRCEVVVLEEALPARCVVAEVSLFRHLRHVNLRAICLTRRDLCVLSPALQGVESLTYHVQHDGGDLTSSCHGAVEEAYPCLRQLHVVYELTKAAAKQEALTKVSVDAAN